MFSNKISGSSKAWGILQMEGTYGGTQMQQNKLYTYMCVFLIISDLYGLFSIISFLGGLKLLLILVSFYSVDMVIT